MDAKSKLKVFHVIEALGGGVYSYFIDLSFTFGEREEVDTTIIYSDKRPEIIPEEVCNDMSPKVILRKLDMVKEISLLKDFKAARDLLKIIRKEKPDILHFHSSKAGAIGRVLSVFLRNKNLKIFYTPHGYSFLRKDISFLKRKVYWVIEKMAIYSPAITIACGVSELEAAKLLGDQKAVKFNNGVDLAYLEKFYTKKENSKTLKIGILGRITEARNPLLFNQVAEENPDVEFVWIGDGNLRSEIKAKNISVTGWILDKKIIYKELNDLDVYLQTSLWEGLPIALLEATALRKPIIASNIVGNKDIVEHGKTGYLFDTKEELNQYIEKLKSTSLRNEFGQAAYEKCKSEFDKNLNFNKMIDYYIFLRNKGLVVEEKE